jgi:peptidyl-prolyl cis-trans isomerase A (cyclophilin A)
MSFGIRVSSLGLCVGLLACEATAPEPRFLKETPEATGQGKSPSSTREVAKPAEPARAPQAAPVTPVPSQQQARPIQREPSTPDPLAGKFSLADASKGLPKKGTLQATIETSAGTIACTLYGDKTPKTVANFVGLARGVRPFWDGKAGAWVKRPLFDGTTFHRAIAGFMIQGGDHLGDGSGSVGYEIPDELVGLKHDRAGLLCMANRGPNTNGGQFFITDAAAPHLTQMNTYTIFGECTPLDVIHKIASAPRPHAMSEKPEPSIPISKVTISRK